MKKIFSIAASALLIVSAISVWADDNQDVPGADDATTEVTSEHVDPAPANDTKKREEKKREEARRQNKEAIDALIKKCQTDIAAAARTADKEAIKTACYDQYTAIIAGTAVIPPRESEDDLDEDNTTKDTKRQEEKKREEAKKLEEKKQEDLKKQAEKQKEVAQKQFEEEIKAMKKKCQADITAAAEADRPTLRTACETAIKAKMDAQKLAEKTQKEALQENKDVIEALKKKCQADYKAATTEADKEAIKTACYAEMSALRKGTPPPSNNKNEAKNDAKKEIKDTIKDSKKETETDVKDTRKQARDEIKAMKIQCQADVKAAAETDKATVKATCEAAIKTKREALRETIKELRSTQYDALIATLKVKFEARLATLSEADKQKYIDNFNKTLDQLLQKAEETGQDMVVLTLEASDEVLNSL